MPMMPPDPAPEAVTLDAESGKHGRLPGWAGFAVAVAAVVWLSAMWWHLALKPEQGGESLLAGINLATLPVELRPSVEKAARTGCLERLLPPPELRSLDRTPVGEPPVPGVLEQVTPVGTIVREVRPRLRWQGCTEATSYVVSLGVVGSDEPALRQELPAGRTDWPPLAPLRRGAVYEWRVEARRGAEVIDRAPHQSASGVRFEVLGTVETAELEKIERQNSGNPLILGTAYLRAGLWEAAAGKYRQLALEHPKSVMAERLRRASEAMMSEPR